MKKGDKVVVLVIDEVDESLPEWGRNHKYVYEPAIVVKSVDKWSAIVQLTNYPKYPPFFF